MCGLRRQIPIRLAFDTLAYLLIKVLPQRWPACGGYAWGLGVHADVVQDLPYLYALSNERDQPHLPAAHWAQQRKDLVDAGDQDHPQIEAVMEDIIKPVLPKEWLTAETQYQINPTERFVVGGPQGDCGLTGRKIIVDTYGGACPHGGAAFSAPESAKARTLRLRPRIGKCFTNLERKQNGGRGRRSTCRSSSCSDVRALATAKQCQCGKADSEQRQ